MESTIWLGTWRVETIGGAPVVDASPATIELEPDGALSGNASINRMTGTWSAGGDRFRIAPGAVTRMAGPPALMEQERRYLDALPRVASGRVENGRLVLSDAEGGEVLTATRDDV